MKAISAEQMRELDRRAMAEAGIPAETLMERAGRGAAAAVRRLAAWRGDRTPRVRLVAGRGNNGGDAFAAARCLREWGCAADVWLAARSGELQGAAQVHFRRMAAAGVLVRELPDEADWERAAAEETPSAIVVDGLLGTGARGAPRGAVARAIRWVNAAGRRNPVVALDLPSGLDADTGQPQGETVRADLTVTMAFPKRGLLTPAALEYVGNLEVADLGFPPALAEGLASDLDLIVAQEVAEALPRRPRASHKGDYGHVLIVGGARGYTGAPALAARAAVRSGAGLVSVLVPASIAPAVAAAAPEAMVHFGAENKHGSLAASALAASGLDRQRFAAVLLGPGMTARPDTRALVEQALSVPGRLAVLDADALNALHGDWERVRAAAGAVVVTPHPGELGRLLGCATAEVQADRLAAARDAQRRGGAVVVLKGAGTLIAAADRLRINLTGNPGLAKGGMGDVLAGQIGRAHV